MSISVTWDLVLFYTIQRFPRARDLHHDLMQGSIIRERRSGRTSRMPRNESGGADRIWDACESFIQRPQQGSGIFNDANFIREQSEWRWRFCAIWLSSHRDLSALKRVQWRIHSIWHISFISFNVIISFLSSRPLMFIRSFCTGKEAPTVVHHWPDEAWSPNGTSLWFQCRQLRMIEKRLRRQSGFKLSAMTAIVTQRQLKARFLQWDILSLFETSRR